MKDSAFYFDSIKHRKNTILSADNLLFILRKEINMKYGIKGIAICSGIGVLIGIVCGVSHRLTERMVNIALDREAPEVIGKTKDYIAGSRNMTEFMDELKLSGNRLAESEYVDVSITGQDGVRLVGHWKTCENPKRIIIAMHGWRSSWTHDFGMASDFWCENNCNVLYAEQRGQNNSGGDYMGFGILERYDCLEWIKWVNNNQGSSFPVYLCGVSMGATTVLMASALNLPDNVKGIIADCGFTSPHAIWKHVAEKNLHIPYEGLRKIVANDMCRKKINHGTRSYSAMEALKQCKVPVLFIHGTEDNFVPVEMTYENYKACTAPKRLLVVPGADHGMSYYIDKNGYENAMIDFWADYD